jgi:hypothetical protein
MRASTAHTVDTGSPSRAAMAVLVMRMRRRASTASTVSGGVAATVRGADGRSAIGSPARHRASHV